MIEWSRREHRDGAITGAIHKFVDATHIVKNQGIKIERNGAILRGPKVLRDVPCVILKINNMMVCLWEGENTEEAIHTFLHEHYNCSNAPSKVELVDIRTGSVVATWNAAMFEVWG